VVLGHAVVDVQAAGRDLEQGATGRQPPLADERDAAVRIEGDDGDGPGVAGDVAFGPGPVGPLDGVDPERQELAVVQDARRDDALDQRLGGDGFGPGGILRGRWVA
jgi:hypothetical protein